MVRIARSGIGARRRGLRYRWTLALTVVGALLVPPACGPVGTFLPSGHRGAGVQPALNWVAPLRLEDGGVLTLIENGSLIATLTDTIVVGPWAPNERTYSIQLRTSVEEPSVAVRLITDPVLQWGNPAQFPGGADAIPPLDHWHWTVQFQGRDDTTNWTSNFQPGTVGRNLTWGNAAFEFTGTLDASASIQVFGGSTTGEVAPAVGYSLNGALSPNTSSANDSDYLSLGRALHPGLVRFGIASSGASVTWDNRNGVPVIGWDSFDKLVSYAHSVPAAIDLTLPVGTWGDGNYLPAGMPLDRSTPIPLGSNTGYFPTDTAFASYVDVVANHTQVADSRIAYWTIGNEMPLLNTSVVDEYTHLFNVAAATIHHRLPSALVGSDVMMNPGYLDRFAVNSQGVGFLSFHYYPALSMCTQSGNYCPPEGGGQGTPDGLLMNRSFDISHGIKFLAPHLAQTRWFNLTGRWLPVFDAESNLNAAGVNAVGYGTDPRQQTLFAGAWLASTLIDGARENLSSLVYFTLTGPATVPATATGPLGGWGFGLTSEGTHDNDTIFAPYWALRLWGEGLPAGSPLLLTRGSDPYGVTAIATGNSSGASILLVNRANVTSNVRLSVSATGGRVGDLVTLEWLDGSTYRENYSAAAHSMILSRSGVATTRLAPGASSVQMSGYEVALLSVVYQAPVNSSGPPGNGSSGNHTSTNGTSPPGGGRPPGPGIVPVHTGRPPLVPGLSDAPYASTTSRIFTWGAAILVLFVAMGAAAAIAGGRPRDRSRARSAGRG